ncbi:STAS domain-containing protein [Streptomyces sp. NPDC098789]|uniref:STAS domain-containing protein n=1 Tax=Streptomyces sp. NPDC098789 TaxID=3366098 RepID=UPI0037FD9C20
MTDHFDREPAPPEDGTGATLRPSTVAVTFEPGPRRILARVRGEIDMDDSPGLSEDLTAALTSSRTGLDLDLSSVTFCDSSGLNVLLDLNRLAAGTDKTLALTAASRPVARLLQLTDTQQLFTVRYSPDDTGPVPPVGATTSTPPPDRPRRRGGGLSTDLPDVCDLCHAVAPEGTAVYGEAADSSFVDPADPGQDGRRPLLTCSPAHLTELQQHYDRRPFDEAELWAVKIDEAMHQHPLGLTIEALCEATGLTVSQIETAATSRHGPQPHPA